MTTPEEFNDWGWRIPFLVSIVLLLVSIWIRLQLRESPVFQKMKDEQQTSKAPWAEAFGKWGNAKFVLIALFGLVAGQAVIWYTGTFYSLFFLQNVLKVGLARRRTSSSPLRWRSERRSTSSSAGCRTRSDDAGSRWAAWLWRSRPSSRCSTR